MMNQLNDISQQEYILLDKSFQHNSKTISN